MATYFGDPNWHKNRNNAINTPPPITILPTPQMTLEPILEEGTAIEVIWSDDYVGQFGFIVSCNEAPYYAIKLASGDIVVLPKYMVIARSPLEALAEAISD